jgi:hypothetical protein
LGALMVITDATALTAESRCFSAMMNWKISEAQYQHSRVINLRTGERCDGWLEVSTNAGYSRILFDRENREMTITEILNTGLAFMGWLFIMVQTGKWFTSAVLKSWDKHRKSSRRQKAIDELYDAFELQSIEPGTTVRLATKGALTIMMFRSEEAAK